MLPGIHGYYSTKVRSRSRFPCWTLREDTFCTTFGLTLCHNRLLGSLDPRWRGRPPRLQLGPRRLGGLPGWTCRNETKCRRDWIVAVGLLSSYQSRGTSRVTRGTFLRNLGPQMIGRVTHRDASPGCCFTRESSLVPFSDSKIECL